MKINSCTTRLLAFQKSNISFAKFERNWWLVARTMIVAIESNHLQGLESKSSIIQNGIGFETNGIFKKVKLQNKIGIY